mmetsp:Transcript_102889/g.320598  ORF Transcript_102889/g.320598 Transcript_102889/m.320598 type:complete len:444 (-) Transcript_102889:24-1355(-)
MAAAAQDVELATVGDKVNIIFKLFDKNKDGTISKTELAEVLQFLDETTWTPQAVEKLLQGSDQNGDGELQFTEFWSWVCGHGRKGESNAVQEALLNRALEKEKAARAIEKVKWEKWQARKAEKDRKAAEEAQKEEQRAAGKRVTRQQFVEDRIAIGLNKEVATKLFRAGDEDNDGEIDKEELEWLAAGQAASVGQIKSLFQEDPSMQQVIETFSRWDSDGDGSISAEELEKVIRILNPDMGEKTVSLIMKEADADRDGNVDIFEFVGWLCGGNPKKKKAKEERQAKVALALHRKRSEEARELGLQAEFEQLGHGLLPRWCKSRKVKATCGTLNSGSSSSCTECKTRHAWLCHGCGFVSFYGDCVNGCAFGTTGWSCVAGKCAKRCGCKKKPDFWQRRGFVGDFNNLSRNVPKMLEHAAQQHAAQEEAAPDGDTPPEQAKAAAS